MLGQEVMQAASAARHEVTGTTRSQCLIDDLASVLRTVEAIGPDVIINCAGEVRSSRALDLIGSNALGPHCLAYAKVRLVHMSTDCVFSGQAAADQRYHHFDLPDPVTLYGRSKLAGEPREDHVLIVRGSFIGADHGFYRWAKELLPKNQVTAWENAYWNGTSVDVMAQALVDLAVSDRVGVVHAAAQASISKGQLLRLLLEEFGHDEVIVTDSPTPEINRCLEPDLELPSVVDAVSSYVRKQECVPVL